MSKCKGSELLHRMNFLSQVQEVINDDCPQQSDLLSFYGHTLHILSRRTQTKMHRDFKQKMCKKCSVLFKEGVNCKFKLRSQGKKKIIEIQCKICKTVKRFGTGERQPKSSKRQENIVSETNGETPMEVDLPSTSTGSLKTQKKNRDHRRRSRKKKRKTSKLKAQTPAEPQSEMQ